MNELKQLRLTIESTNDHSPGSGKFAAWYEHLIAQELEPELAASIVESIERKQGTDHSGQKDGRSGY